MFGSILGLWANLPVGAGISGAVRGESEDGPVIVHPSHNLWGTIASSASHIPQAGQWEQQLPLRLWLAFGTSYCVALPQFNTKGGA